MTARTPVERDRRRALVFESLAVVLAVWGLAGAVLGYLRAGTPGPTDLTLVVGALALRAHAEVYRLRALVERIGERAGKPS